MVEALILLIPLRLQSGLGTCPAAGVNGSKTGIETKLRFEGTLIAGQSEKCGLLLLCAQPITHRVSRLGKLMCKKLVASSILIGWNKWDLAHKSCCDCEEGV